MLTDLQGHKRLHGRVQGQVQVVLCPGGAGAVKRTNNQDILEVFLTRLKTWIKIIWGGGEVGGEGMGNRTGTQVNVSSPDDGGKSELGLWRRFG